MKRRTSRIPDLASSMRERAYAYVCHKIVSGALKPETPISELVLARELEMSRTPIREALNQLAAEGLLEQTANRGTVVVQLKRRDLVELYELREALEVYSARKAAQSTLRPADLARWQDLADEILQIGNDLVRSGRPALSRDEMHRFVVSDLNFHNMLMRMAVNDRILKVVNETRVLTRIFAIEQPAYDAATLERIHHQHNLILQGIAEHDPDRAVELLSRHIRTSLAERLDAYDEWERETSLRKSSPAFFGFSS